MGYFSFPHTRSYDSDLGWLIKSVKSYNDTIQTLNDWISENEPRMDDIEAFINALNSGELPDGVKDGMLAWMSQNANAIFATMMKNVFFGLTDAGYFVAYIPDSWSDIIFKTTGLDIDLALQPEYGHLVLQY